MLSLNPTPTLILEDCYLVQLSSLLESYNFFQGWILCHGPCSVFVNKLRKSLKLNVFSICKYLDIHNMQATSHSSLDKTDRSNSANLTQYNLFSSCHIKPFISGTVTRLHHSPGMWEGSSKDFKVTIWYPQSEGILIFLLIQILALRTWWLWLFYGSVMALPQVNRRAIHCYVRQMFLQVFLCYA